MTQGKWDGSDLSELSYDYLHAVLLRMEQHGRESAKFDSISWEKA